MHTWISKSVAFNLKNSLKSDVRNDLLVHIAVTFVSETREWMVENSKERRRRSSEFGNGLCWTTWIKAYLSAENENQPNRMLRVKSYSMVGMTACMNLRNTSRYSCTPRPPPSPAPPGAASARSVRDCDMFSIIFFITSACLCSSSHHNQSSLMSISISISITSNVLVSLYDRAYRQGCTENMDGWAFKCGNASTVTVFFAWSWLMSSYVSDALSGFFFYSVWSIHCTLIDHRINEHY